MDPLLKFTFGVRPEELTKSVGRIGIFFFAKIILPDVKQALLDPRGGEKVCKESLVEKNGFLDFIRTQIGLDNSPEDRI